MEEARQYPALTASQWVRAIAWATRPVCMLAALVCCLVYQRAILPLMLVFLLSLTITGIIDLVQMLSQEKARWFKKIFARADRPVGYWMAVATCVVGIGVVAAASAGMVLLILDSGF